MKNLIQKKGIAILLLMTLFSLSMSTEAFSQKKKNGKEVASESQQIVGKDNGQTVTLVTSGTGATEEEATRNALRSAIEQTFGTFVSANTSVVNDDLVKDDIVTVTSGNIKSYKEIDSRMINDNLYEITLQAVVSIDNLIHFAQSHGMSAELAGQTFAMNIKIAELNKQNENRALYNLVIQLYDIAKMGLYDFSIHMEEPVMVNGNATVTAYIIPTPNDNYKAYVELAKKTVGSLSMSQTEFKNIKSLGMGGYVCGWYEHYEGMKGKDLFIRGKGDIRLRNDINNFHDSRENEALEIVNGANFIYYYERFKYLSKFAFSIQDNLGNGIDPEFNLDKLNYAGSDGYYGKRMRSLGNTNEYTHSDKVVAQVTSGKFIQLPGRSLVKYYVGSYAGFSEISAIATLRYSMSNVSKLTKIDVTPIQIKLLDNETLMDVAKGTWDPGKALEEANKFLALANEETHEERLRYLNMADDLYEILERIAKGDTKAAIVNTRKQIKAAVDKLLL